jgi:hypothetical protein
MVAASTTVRAWKHDKVFSGRIHAHFLSFPVSVKLAVEYSDTYPEEPAKRCQVLPLKGLTTGQVVELQNLANSIAEENLGMPCVFSVAEELKQWLFDNNVPPSDGSMRSEMLERERRREKLHAKEAAEADADAMASAEMRERLIAQAARYEETGVAAAVAESTEEERRKERLRHGTPVTPETFVAWRKKFEAEQGIDKEAEEAAEAARMSGRKWFQQHGRGIAVSAAAAAAEEADKITQAAAAASGGGGGGGDDDYGASAAEEAVPIDASIFASAGEVEDGDMSDLDDLDDLDDDSAEEEGDGGALSDSDSDCGVGGDW